MREYGGRIDVGSNTGLFQSMEKQPNGGLFNRGGWGFSEKCNGKKMWVQIRQRKRGSVGWLKDIVLYKIELYRRFLF